MGTDVKWHEAATEWIDVMKVQGPKGSRTRREHQAHVASALQDIAALKDKPAPEVLLSEVRRSDIVKVLSLYRHRPDGRYTTEKAKAPQERSSASVRRRLAALRAFFSWCAEEDYLDKDPSQGVKTSPPSQRISRSLTPEQARDVLAGAKLGASPERDMLACALLLTCGLSLQEMAALKASSFTGTTMRVTGRSGAERIVPLSPLAQRALMEYLPVRATLLEEAALRTDALFVSRRPRTLKVAGEEVTTMDMSYASMGEALERILGRAGVDGAGVRAQALRATFATLALQSGSHTVRELQEALGHQGLTGIRDYAVAAGVDLHDAAKRHPLADG